MQPTPMKPKIIIAQVEASGTPEARSSTRRASGGPVSVTTKVRTFVPTLNQSLLVILKGCRFSNASRPNGSPMPVSLPLRKISPMLSTPQNPLIAAPTVSTPLKVNVVPNVTVPLPGLPSALLEIQLEVGL